MYSKFNERRPPRPPLGGVPTRGNLPKGDPTQPPSVPQRAPSYHRRMNVPPNYSGLAIVDGEERIPGAEPPAELPPVPESPSGVMPENRDFGQEVPPTPRFDGLRQVSELPRRELPMLPVVAPAAQELSAQPRSGGLFDLSHFPFGHGLGTEEWLLIGLILLLLHEADGAHADRGDLDETVILLALLLLGG